MNKLSFIHTHYIPPQLLTEASIDECVIAIEAYPDLLLKYYGDYEIFDSIEDCILWHKTRCPLKKVKFTIENITLINDPYLLKNAKDLGLFSVQLYHSQANKYFDKKRGFSELGVTLLKILYENDIYLDLSHLKDEEIRTVLSIYPGKIINSHCVCSELIETIHPRSNAISSETIKILSEKKCLFGIPFVNDLVSKISHDTDEKDSNIMTDIVTQITYFVKCAGVESVALGPDFMDEDYFSKVFKQKIRIPEILYTTKGYKELKLNLKECNILENDINLIFNENAKKHLII